MGRFLFARSFGVPIVLLGAWGGIVPFVGPLFGYPMPPGSDISAWQWSAMHVELHLLPGIAAIIGGMMLLGVGRLASSYSGALLALLAGSWFVLGPVFSPAFLGGGGMTMGEPSTFMRIVTPLGYHYGTGSLIVIFSALALGLLSAPALREPQPVERTRAEPRLDRERVAREREVARA